MTVPVSVENDILSDLVKAAIRHSPIFFRVPNRQDPLNWKSALQSQSGLAVPEEGLRQRVQLLN